MYQMSLEPKLTILIGEQATGKSTIARTVYYCLTFIDNEISKMCDSTADKHKKHLEALQLHFRRNYDNGNVLFCENNYEVTLNAKDGFIPRHNDDIFATLDGFTGADAIYIPAGRSTIPLLFESYAAAKSIKVDPFFDQYLLFLDSLRKGSLASMNDLLDDALKFSVFPVNEEAVRASIDIMEQILKGKYHNKKGDVRIIYDKNESVPLIVASSGQQEILYILVTLLYVLLNPRDFTIIIEEPEAHIYPAAQKLFMELIAHVINASDSRVIITTHSPYILTATNLLVHSAKVENSVNNEKVIVNPLARLEPSCIGAILLERNGTFSYQSIIDLESGLIAAEKIDAVSEIIDKGMTDLINLEVKHGL